MKKPIFTRIEEALKALWEIISPTPLPVPEPEFEPIVDLSTIEDLNRFLEKAATGHFGETIAASVNRMRDGIQSTIGTEAPGAVSNTVTLVENLLKEVAKDKAFLATKSHQAVLAALADLETRVKAVRAALQDGG